MNFNDVVRENNDLRSKLNECEGRHKRDLDLALAKLQNDLDRKSEKDVETIRLEGQHFFNIFINKICLHIHSEVTMFNIIIVEVLLIQCSESWTLNDGSTIANLKLLKR